MIKKLKATLGSKMARNSGWMLVGQLSRVVLQAGLFLSDCRSLGVTEYGAFVDITSLVMIVSPFSGLGAGNIIIMKVARDPAHFAESWGKALFLGLSTGVVLGAVVILIANFALPKGDLTANHTAGGRFRSLRSQNRGPGRDGFRSIREIPLECNLTNRQHRIQNRRRRNHGSGDQAPHHQRVGLVLRHQFHCHVGFCTQRCHGATRLAFVSVCGISGKT